MRCLVSSLSSTHRGVWPTCLGLGQTGPGFGRCLRPLEGALRNDGLLQFQLRCYRVENAAWNRF